MLLWIGRSTEDSKSRRHGSAMMMRGKSSTCRTLARKQLAVCGHQQQVGDLQRRIGSWPAKSETCRTSAWQSHLVRRSFSLGERERTSHHFNAVTRCVNMAPFRHEFKMRYPLFCLTAFGAATSLPPSIWRPRKVTQCLPMLLVKRCASR